MSNGLPPLSFQPVVFVGNNIDCVENAPIEVIRKHFFRRATESEAVEIRKFLSRRSWPGDDSIYFERKAGANTRAASEVDHRYYVIHRERSQEVDLYNGIEHDELEAASRLTDFELILRLVLMGPGCWGIASRDEHLRICERSSLLEAEPRKITKSDLELIGRTARKIKECSTKGVAVTKAVSLFHRLGDIDRGHSLYALGTFAVLESVLAHNPRGGYDSLTHQLSAKMTLLNKRFEFPLDYSLFQLTEQKVWKLLYAFRSSIAHGSEPNFKSDLRHLKDFQSVVRFMDEAVKKVLQLGLEDPSFLQDLQSC